MYVLPMSILMMVYVLLPMMYMVYVLPMMMVYVLPMMMVYGFFPYDDGVCTPLKAVDRKLFVYGDPSTCGKSREIICI
jgi:hypothetical protein